ncbi:30S ribosomal protein S16 [Candidatus Babeliales bacterium]|nr:30S ribosomal protein S16 [Candidatus Babeliales bacterium]
MAVKIRFARIGKKHAPIYRIVAIDSRKKRDGEFLENLGTYNPKTKQIVQMHDDRVAYWLSVGAEPTDVVARLLTIRRKQNPAALSEVSKASTEKKAASKKADTPKKVEAKKAKKVSAE